MFQPTLSCVIKLLLATSSGLCQYVLIFWFLNFPPPGQTDVLVSLGRLLSAIITTLGPELAGSEASTLRSRSAIQVAASIMNSGGPSLQAEAISCLQQLHMFTRPGLQLSDLVPELVILLTSPHLGLRRASVACLRQLAQREAVTVCEGASGVNLPLKVKRKWKMLKAKYHSSIFFRTSRV